MAIMNSTAATPMSTNPALDTMAELDSRLLVTVSFSSACLLLVAAHFIRVKLAFLRHLFLPSSLIAGLLGISIVQLVKYHPVLDEVVQNHCMAGWKSAPSLLVNVVFACLFLGSEIPSVSRVWAIAGPQLMYGQILAWGQYAIPLLVTVLILKPVFNVNDLIAPTVALGFEGGHGTAAGVRTSFVNLGYEEGAELTLCSATIGLLSGVIFGTLFINWSVRNGKMRRSHSRKPAPTGDQSFATVSETEFNGVYTPEDRPSAGLQTVSIDSLDSLALHVGFVGIALLFAYGCKKCLMLLENESEWLTEYKFFSAFPLFPFAMFGGILIQKIADNFGTQGCIDRGTMERISGFALDFVVVTAITAMSFDGIKNSLAPFFILIVLTWMWHLFCIFFVAPWILPDFWAERAVSELGQSLGITATGLLLLRMSDPNNETPALAAFSYKQLLHTPIVAGGLWTAAVLPLIKSVGLWATFGISTVAVLFWLMVYLCHFRRQYRRRRAAKEMMYSELLIGTEVEEVKPLGQRGASSSSLRYGTRRF